MNDDQRKKLSKNYQNTSIIWKNLCYNVNVYNFYDPESKCPITVKKSKKTILKRLNGHLNYQTLNGFLGPSGAGKTTLLDCLNGSIQNGLTNDSEIYLNCIDNKKPMIRMIEQHVHETIIGSMTINQILHYAFRFKNHSSSHSSSKIDEHIKSILDELLLDEKILENRFENCSGGEQKRIAIAQELMTLEQPNFLFLDEPTTGLDSNSALLVMQCLRRLADFNSHLTIIMSIHSPSSDIVALFDKLYIIAKGGVCIYFDSPKNLQLKLEKHHQLNENEPPIEAFLKIACEGITDSTVQNLANCVIDEQNALFSSSLDYDSQSFINYVPIKRKTFNFKDFHLQLSRLMNLVFIIERWKILKHFLTFLSFAAVISMLFKHTIVRTNTCYRFDNLNNDDDHSYAMNQTCFDRLNDKNSVDQYRLYTGLSISIYGFAIACLSVLEFIPMLKFFSNEHRNQWYSLGTFYLSLMIVKTIELCFISFYLTVMLYFFINHMVIDDNRLNFNRFGNFLLFTSANNIYLQGFGIFFGSIFTNREIILLINIITVQTVQMFNGVLFSINEMNNPLLTFISDLMMTKYPQNGLIYSRFFLDVCNEEYELSYALVDYGIDSTEIYSDLLKIMAHIPLIRFASLIILWFRFSVKKPKITQSESQLDDKIGLIPIDFPKRSSSLKSTNTINFDEINRQKKKEEIDFENFTKGKIMIAWRSVTLFATDSIFEIRSAQAIDKDAKLILRNLNGQFRFGTLNALMGPSGAGKTSLLKVLNGQMKTRLSHESQFYLTKYCPTRVCYLTQEISGHLMPGLTALQSLIYASKMKNFRLNKKINHGSIAMNILNELGISDAAENYVQNCSGGERKRLALGLELTSLFMPNLICIDEPTSGLDSNSSKVVVECLANLARRHNLTIIASIHQPNVDTLMMFDQIYVLAFGGVCVYSGKPEKIEHHLPLDSSQDNLLPIERLIKYSCNDYRNPDVQKLSQSTNENILNEYENITDDTVNAIDGIPTNRNRFQIYLCWIYMLRYCSFIKGFQWMILVLLAIVYAIQPLILYLLFERKIVYYNGCINPAEDLNTTCNKTEQDIEHELDLEFSFRYIITVANIFIPIVLIQSAYLFSKDFNFFRNESRNGWYSSGTFYLPRIIMEWIYLLVVLSIFIYVIDIYEDVRPGVYIWLLIIYLLGSFAMQGIANILAILTGGEMSILAIMVPGISMVCIILGNTATPIRQLHYFYQFLSLFSPIRFIVESVAMLLYAFDRCLPKEIQVLLYLLNIHHDEHFNFCILALIFQICFYHLLAFLIIMIKSNHFESRKHRAEKILNYHKTLKRSNVIIPGLGCDHQFAIKKFGI